MKREYEEAERTENAIKVNTSLSKLLKGGKAKNKAMVVESGWQDDNSRNS